MNQRVHTFGVGHGASEELIKQAAFKGYGHFSFIYNEEEIEERVVSAQAKTRLNYLILQKAALFDANGSLIEKVLDMAEQPILEGTFVELSCLMAPGVKASSFSVEVIDPNHSTVTRYQGHVQATESQSMAAYAVSEAMKEMRERHIKECE